MRRYLPVVIALLSLLNLAFRPAVLTESDFARYQVSPYQIEQMVPRPMPELSAKAALLMDGTSGTILYAKSEHDRLAPASTTKMVTALVAVQGANLGDHVAIMPSDLFVGSCMGLSTGEEPTIEELLYALLLVSDNAVAVTIARHVAGSEKTFVGLMNQWVTEHGLQDTHFSNPQGFDETMHFSSAYDLAIIGRQLIQSRILTSIVATKEQWAASRLLENTNELLGTYAGANGVKTGTTDAAGQCLVASAKRDGGWVVAVVLGSQDRYADARALLDYYFTGYFQTSLSLEPSPLARIQIEGGEWRPLVVRDDAQVLLTRWQVGYLRSFLWIDTANLSPGLGEAVGRVTYDLFGQTVAELPVYIGGY
ncbi:MAG: D-alanyl-D-alanine carboxypeptidase [Anaerolineae bacterium]|nr:D-alanyl-D-alanine carboxypeptidase [Anaerolineae bacterium]